MLPCCDGEIKLYIYTVCNISQEEQTWTLTILFLENVIIITSTQNIQSYTHTPINIHVPSEPGLAGCPLIMTRERHKISEWSDAHPSDASHGISESLSGPHFLQNNSNSITHSCTNSFPLYWHSNDRTHAFHTDTTAYIYRVNTFAGIDWFTAHETKRNG